jgi:hypothetical protein
MLPNWQADHYELYEGWSSDCLKSAAVLLRTIPTVAGMFGYNNVLRVIKLLYFSALFGHLREIRRLLLIPINPQFALILDNSNNHRGTGTYP